MTAARASIRSCDEDGATAEQRNSDWLNRRQITSRRLHRIIILRNGGTMRCGKFLNGILMAFNGIFIHFSYGWESTQFNH